MARKDSAAAGDTQLRFLAAARAVERGFGLSEWLEDAREHLVAQADPGVPHANHSHVLRSRWHYPSANRHL
jgi:hypothetical protein